MQVTPEGLRVQAVWDAIQAMPSRERGFALHWFMGALNVPHLFEAEDFKDSLLGLPDLLQRLPRDPSPEDLKELSPTQRSLVGVAYRDRPFTHHFLDGGFRDSSF
jgi:hypothetical protein